MCTQKNFPQKMRKEKQQKKKYKANLKRMIM